MSERTRRRREAPVESPRTRGRSRGGDEEAGGDRRPGRSKFQYRSRSADDMEKRKHMTEDRDYFFNNIYPKYKVRDGENINRLLPPTWDVEKNEVLHWGYDVYVHYQIGADKATYLCLDKMKKQPCPICEERNLAYRDGDVEYGDTLKWSHVLLVLIIDRKDESAGPQLWTMPMQKVDAELLIRSKDRISGNYLEIDNPDQGYDFFYTKTGKGLNTKYTGVDIDRHATPLGTLEQMDEWLIKVQDNSIPSVLVYHEYEHIKKVCCGSTPVSRETASSREDTSSKDSSGANLDNLEYSYEDVMSMDVEKLDSFASSVLGFTDQELDNLDNDNLRKEVCKELGLKPPVEDAPEIPKDSARSRLEDMKDRYSRRGS